MVTRLVVLRGAKVEHGEYKEMPYSKVVFDGEEMRKIDGKGWIMPVYTKAFAMEQGWLKAEGRRLNVKNTSSSSPSKPGRTSSAPTVPRKSLKTENAEVKKPDKSSPMEAWLRSIGLLVRSKNSNKGTQNEETWLEAEEKKLNIKYTPNSLNAGPNSRESVAALKNPQS